MFAVRGIFADRAKLAALFGHLIGIGLDDPRGPGPGRE